MQYNIQRDFATTSSGMSQMTLRKNTVTEGGVFQGDHRDEAQETRGGLMPHTIQNRLFMSQRTKAETPWTPKVKTTFRFRVDRILPKILSSRRPFRILQVCWSLLKILSSNSLLVLHFFCWVLTCESLSDVLKVTKKHGI